MITLLDPARIDQVTTFARSVFNEFVAPFNSDEGNLQFNANTNAEEMRKRIDEGRSTVFTYVENDKIVGMIAGKSNHISLMFVDAQHHRKGIGRQLFTTYLTHFDPAQVTVNSSIYAIEAYRRLGFVETDVEQIKNGLRYVPMLWTRKEFTS